MTISLIPSLIPTPCTPAMLATGPFAHPLARSAKMLARSSATHCFLHEVWFAFGFDLLIRSLVRSLVRSFAHSCAHSLALLLVLWPLKSISRSVSIYSPIFIPVVFLHIGRVRTSKALTNLA